MMLSTLMAAALAAEVPITAPGPQGPLAGTLTDAGKKAPVVLIVPGSGPTDRDGNNPLGVSASSYRLLAEDLWRRGVSSVRIDKRGLFESKTAVADGNAVTIADYAADVHNWAAVAAKRQAVHCVWLLGHSEGGLIALAAAQEPKDICGLILVATPGRKLGDILREQLRANPANAPILDPALAALAELEAGRRVDVSTIHPALQGLFAPQVQGFLIDMLAKDPAALAAKVKLPVLIVQGGKDLQVSIPDARALAKAKPDARLLIIPGMNHVLKDVASDDRAGNVTTYRDPSLPVDGQLVGAIVDFVKP
jgi:pimeloyl-ACP methyl ester carboxylesterase